MFASQAFDLICLCSCNLLSICKVVVNDFLVVDVDERPEEGTGGGDQREAPEGDYLDKKIGDEGGSTGCEGMCDVLREQYSLKLDDEKIDQLLNIFKGGLKSFARDSVIAFWAEGRCHTL